MPINGFDRNVGASPIRADQPAGENPRDGEAYTAMRSQIDLLTDIHASTVAVDWKAIIGLGAQVLGQEGKDLAAGAWLTVALFHTHALVGLAEGIHVLRDLVATYWDEMSPSAARLRGRRNQIQWMLDHLSEGLQDPSAEFTPMQPEVHSELLADWEALDAAWQAHDDEAPAFYGLRATLASLPVERPAEPKPDTSTSGAAPAAGTATMAAVAVPMAGSDPETVAENALAGLRPLIDWYLQEDTTLPLLYRLNRICAWSTLEHAPPAQNGATRLPAPPDQVIVGFEKIAQGGDPQAVIHFAESRLIGLRYWLDLNRASHAALSRLGATDAATTVAFETGRLLLRLPELAQMRFSDGRPFADPDTQAWLEALDSDGPHASGGSGTADAVTELTKAADADAVAGKLNDALDNLQAAARHAGSQRDNFRLRLAQCALLQRFDARADMRPLLATLIKELDAHRLATWEPDLARQALKLAAAVELRYGASDAGSNESMLARLASLDLRAAWQLSQSTAAA